MVYIRETERTLQKRTAEHMNVGLTECHCSTCMRQRTQANWWEARSLEQNSLLQSQNPVGHVDPDVKLRVYKWRRYIGKHG